MHPLMATASMHAVYNFIWRPCTRGCVCFWLKNMASQNETLSVPFASTVDDMNAIFIAITAPRSKHVRVARATCQLGVAGSVHGAGGRVAGRQNRDSDPLGVPRAVEPAQSAYNSKWTVNAQLRVNTGAHGFRIERGSRVESNAC